MSTIEQHLGDKAELLLNFSNAKISKDRLHLPGGQRPAHANGRVRGPRDATRWRLPALRRALQILLGIQLSLVGGTPPALLPGAFETDRVMLCGSPAMLEELRRSFERQGFSEGSHSDPGHFVIEKAFVER